ncbi:hypothetical protein BC826DRAFT_1053156, partial [Russula brevipes]
LTASITISHRWYRKYDPTTRSKHWHKWRATCGLRKNNTNVGHSVQGRCQLTEAPTGEGNIVPSWTCR